MQSVRLHSQRTTEPGGEALLELDTASCHEAAELVLSVRAALAEERRDDLATMAHPLALRREQARVALRLGGVATRRFWSDAVSEIEAVRMVREGLAEVYERARHRGTGACLRFVSRVEHVRGRWRITDSGDATDERLTAVLLQGVPAQAALDPERWMQRWTERHGPTTTLRWEDRRGRFEHREEGWVAHVQTGSGRELARALAATGSAGELIEKQPAATVVSMAPALDARARTEQLRWLTRAVAVLGAADCSSVWVPSAAKAVPSTTWLSTTEGPLELPALSTLWLRTQRQRGAWITRGMSSFMLPELEVLCAGLTVATVRALMREAAGRLLAHHHARIDEGLGATAPAVPALAPRLYRRGPEGLEVLAQTRLETALDPGDGFVLGAIEATLEAGRQGPRAGESYGRWGAIALRAQPAWWVEAA
jgi:hypothetical protein